MTFTTLFDMNYAPQGLALLRSIFRHEPEARVVVLSMCKDTAKLLRSLHRNDGELVVITPDTLPDAYHEKARTRTRAEQCWMATPFLVQHVLTTYGHCEYLDADCWLLSNLNHIRREIGKAPIGLVHHRWDAEHADRLKVNGSYNVGYVYWTESPQACNAVDEWVNRTLDWPENERYNDQLLIEDWPAKYGAHIIQSRGMGLAPYSQQQYDIRECEFGVTVDGELLTEYHFHEWKIQDDGTPFRGGYRLQWEVEHYIYDRYEKEIGAALAVI